MLKHCLCYLKIIRSEIRKNQAETRVNQTIVNSLIKTGFEAACDGFRVLIKKKDQVEFFMTELESLAYFCYFATAAGKISQTCQFATVVKSLVETFIKKIDSEDRHNILVEVMIFSKKYLIPKAQRFNLYQLLITTLVLYASALSQTDQKTKAILYVDKVLSLLHTIEPDSQLVGTLLSLMTIYRERSLKEASAVQAEDYYVKVTVQDPEISKADPISDGSYDGDDKEESEARAQRKKKKLFKEKKVKMEPLSSGLFIRGFADHQVSEQTFMKFSQKWVSKRKSEKEKSLNKTLNKEFKIISINESAQKKIAASRPSIGKPKDYSETEKRSKSSQKQTQGQQIFLRNSAFTLKDVHSRSELRDSLVPTQGKSFIRPGTATFGARRSGIGSSLVVSRKNSIDQADRLSTFNQLQLKRQNLGASGQEGKGSVFFIDNFQAGNHQEIESSSDEEQKPKPKSMAKKLQNLLYKAELREQMPDKYRFLKNKPKAKAMSRQSKWNHQRYTSMETDGSTAFTASKDWLYDRMLASRPRLDEDRALTHNKTMNIKNHQVMIEFKTGDHVELQMAKKKKNLDYKQKTFLVNCSYTGDTVSNHLSKGVPLGYCDHQFEARKHSYIEKLELKSAMVSRRSSAKHSVQEGNLHSQAHSNARLNLHSSHKGSSRDLAQGNHKASNNPSIDNLNTLKPSNHRNQTSAPAVSKFIKKVDRVSDYHSKSGKVDEDIKECRI